MSPSVLWIEEQLRARQAERRAAAEQRKHHPIGQDPPPPKAPEQVVEVWRTCPDNPRFEQNQKGQLRTRNYLPPTR